MELFTAGDKSQMKTIERWIDESDVYMLILGGRYGSIEPKTGISYTELEYDYAVAQGKPTFAVVITEEALEAKVKALGSAVIERGNPKGLVQFREKVLSNVSSFFSDSKDVKLAVYESISDHAVNPKLKGWVAADEVEETKDLTERIKRLNDENAALVERARQLESELAKRGPERSRDKSHTELVDVLNAIEITVPANLAKDRKEYKDSLYNIAYVNRDALVNGITNQVNSSEAMQFYYFSILPKLQAHGLADSEKVAGARYRRSFLNKAGKSFFAEVEKKLVLPRQTVKAVSAASAQIGNDPQKKPSKLPLARKQRVASSE